MNKRILITAGIVLIALITAALLLTPNVDIPFKSSTKERAVGGMVTRKFTNCQGGEQLNQQTGKVSPIPQSDITCDLGSTITVDGVGELITATGKVPQNMAYSVDVSNIKVGDSVLVRYRLEDDGTKTLQCANCGVEKQR